MNVSNGGSVPSTDPRIAVLDDVSRALGLVGWEDRLLGPEDIAREALNPASRPNYPCVCGPDEYCASDECHGAVPDPAKERDA